MNHAPSPRPRTAPPISAARLALAALVAALLSACAPGAQPFSAPGFTLVADGSGLLRLDPPGIGSGEATFRFVLAAENPNPFPLRLAGIDGSFRLAGRHPTDVRSAAPLDLPARGRGRLVLDVTLPVVTAPALLADLAGLVRGDPTDYALDGAVTVDLLGGRQRLPSATLVRGTWATPVRMESPRFRLDTEASGLRLFAPDRAVIDLAVDIENPNPLGFALSAPALDLIVAGGRTAAIALAPTPLPALGSSRAVLRIELDLDEIGRFAATRIGLAASGAAGLDLEVTGPLLLEVPGIASFGFEAATLVRDAVR